MKGGGRTDGPAGVRHWWNGKVIQSRVDSGVRSTHPRVPAMPCDWRGGDMWVGSLGGRRAGNAW